MDPCQTTTIFGSCLSSLLLHWHTDLDHLDWFNGIIIPGWYLTDPHDQIVIFHDPAKHRVLTFRRPVKPVQERIVYVCLSRKRERERVGE